jgi:hypothetical protein
MRPIAVHAGLLDQNGSLLLVAHPGVQAGNPGEHGGPVARTGERDVVPESLGCFRDAIERHQDLQHIAVRLARLGLRLLPRACRLQRRIAGPRLEGDVDGALIQCRVVRLAGSVQDQRIAGRGFGPARVDLADQELVEQFGVERSRGCAFGLHALWRGLRMRGLGQCQQEQRERCKQMWTLHRTIIIQACFPHA